MHIIEVTNPGGPEVLKMQDIPIPEIKEDEVLIKIVATVVNGSDILGRQNLYPKFPGQISYMGLECSGIIEKIGKNVKMWKVDDEVTLLLL